MKRIICLTVAAILLLACVPSVMAEEREEVTFTSELAGSITRTASEWTGSSSDRAMLTVLLALEAAIDRQFGSTDILYILSNDSYVLKSGTTIFLGGFTDDYIYVISYTPATKKAAISRLPNLAAPNTSSVVKNALETSSSATVYKNEPAEILKWLQVATDTVN